MHITKSAEQVYLKLEGSLIAFERMQGGGLQLGLAEYKRPQYVSDESTARLPISKFHYADVRLGEITLEKAFEAIPYFANQEAVYNPTDIALLRSALDKAYNERSADQSKLPSLVRIARKSGSADTIRITMPVQILHYDFQDANIEGEELVMLRVAVQPCNLKLSYNGREFDLSRYVQLQ